jgi:hypothetical protein
MGTEMKHQPGIKRTEMKLSAYGYTVFPDSECITQTMSNDRAYELGRIAAQAGSPLRSDVGSSIDRGLILLKLLQEQGYVLLHGN